MQARLATAHDHQIEVLAAALAFLVGHRRAFSQRAEQQEAVEEVGSARLDAHGREGVDIQAAHLDIFHAAFGQCMHRFLAAVGHPLGTDRAVELVFDLQQVGIELLPLAVGIVGAQLGVARVGQADRLAHADDVAFQAVVADVQSGLGIVVVAQVAHPQAGGVGQVQALIAQRLQLVIAALKEAGTQCRGGAEQVHQQPGVAAEVADQPNIALGLVVLGTARIPLLLLHGLPQRGRQREVVVDTGNALHGLAVTNRQPTPVDVFEHADVGGAVPANRNIVVTGGQDAGHGLGPQQFIAQLAVGKAVDAVQLGKQLVDTLADRGDQLHQRFGVVGSDTRVGQRRTPGRRMWLLGKLAAVVDAQAFLFDAMHGTP